ncbi:uncharacterized protein LOC126584536 [Malus sylvestris]|uniref:uncharacterized protein LOC126584536 n=1 Tax=Malus sylvestris TaxID=3752 RepID=UPI0021ACD9B8|nr:uncharacterized protein LOC126584536 [Malus sylvestris]
MPSPPFEPRKELHLAVTCSIASQGNGRHQPPRRRSERRSNKDGSKKRGSRKSNASSQEEIITLFRRIQTSISKEDAVEDEKISSDDFEDRPHSDSILRALHGRQNFVKRSPIPPQSIPRSKFLELDNGATPSATRRSGTGELDLVREEEMKLPELKELAKWRGIKGYSKFRIYFFRFMQS